MIFQSLDINECTEVGMNKCDSNAICTDVAGSFTCTCNQGYTGNGTTCTSEYTILILSMVADSGHFLPPHFHAFPLHFHCISISVPSQFHPTSIQMSMRK